MSKERLVELLRKRSCWYNKCEEHCNICRSFPLTDDEIDVLTDYLLANGVIVPPCKVGDKLYRAVELLNGEKFVVEGEALEYAETLEIGTVKKRIYFRAKGESFAIRNYSLWFEISEFGKTVFLTREEAEAKLKEGEGK